MATKDYYERRHYPFRSLKHKIAYIKRSGVSFGNMFTEEGNKALKNAIQKVVDKVDRDMGLDGIEQTIDLKGYITEESKWFLSNDYLPFFLKNKNALNYEYQYLPESQILEISKKDE